MKVIRHEWYNVSAAREFRIIPIGDVHIGAAACDEDLLIKTVSRIEADPDCYWVGMGDYCEFINRSDKRFDTSNLASWLQVRHLGDIAKAQRDRFVGIVAPIATKCLGLLKGNHEQTIWARYERDIYSEIVTKIKGEAGLPAEHPLGLGYYGWLQLAFYWGANRRGGSRVLKIVGHHGSKAGRLEGSKALDMQRWLWVHDCDLALMGHSHNTQTQAQDVIALTKTGKPIYTTRKGAFTGTFLGIPTTSDGYAERAGFYHSPVGTITAHLHPCHEDQPRRVRLEV